jgi:hypothetical protein
MTNPLCFESLHLHLHRAASGAYPALHVYLDDDVPMPQTLHVTTGVGPINVSSPVQGSPAFGVLDSSGNVTICAFGKVSDPTVCNVWGQVYSSQSGIPSTPPSSAVPGTISSGQWTIPRITFPLQSGVQTYYCVIWYRYVTSSGLQTFELLPIQFTPDTSAGITECEKGVIGRVAGSATSESFPVEYVLSPSHVTSASEHLSWPIVLKRSSATEAAAWNWRSDGWLRASLSVCEENGRYIGLLCVGGVLGAQFRSTISWRCENWRSFGQNQLTLLNPCLSPDWPHSFLVEPAR